MRVDEDGTKDVGPYLYLFGCLWWGRWVGASGSNGCWWVLTDDPAHHTRIKFRSFRPCGFQQFIPNFYATDATGQALFFVR